MSKRRKSLRYALLAGTALTAQPLMAGELPTGASVVHGSVGISTPAAGRMAIQQSSKSAIVSWRGFSIGADAAVDIQQPSASSAILNRVTGATPSTIAGRLTANGQVFLVNPNGVAITPSGSVRAGAFVASTLDIADEDFLEGRHTFTGNGHSAPVTNQGTIEIGRGGYAALLGGKIDNAGTVSVPLGRIGFGAGERVTLDLSGDGFLSVAIPSEGAAADALIRHSGRLSADGGRIEISSATARQAARYAVNLSGVVEARTVSGRPGEIVLSGGDGGGVAVSGRLDASAREAAGAAGGSIDITGSEIALAGATLDASGRGGGGTIRVGGDYQGGGTLLRARATAVDEGTRISADALEAGDGGRVILWSDELTVFEGEISARGGPAGGDGGFAEVSGKARLDFGGRVDLSAPAGAAGTLLLDPFDILIAETDDNENQNIDVSFGEGGPDFYEPETVERDPGTSIIDPDDLLAALEFNDVVVTNTGALGGTEEGDIAVAAALTWDSGQTLTLDALDDIFINATVTILPPLEAANGGLVLDAGDNIALNAAITAPGGTLSFTAVGDITGAGPVSAVSGDISMITGGSGNDMVEGGSVDVGAVSVGDGDFELDADGDGAVESLSAPDGFVDISVGGGLVLGTVSAPEGVLFLGAEGDGAFESVSAPGSLLNLFVDGDLEMGAVSAEGADLFLGAGGLLTVAGPVAGGDGFLSLSGSEIVIENLVSWPGGIFDVGTDGTITTTGAGEVSVGSFLLSSGDWVQIAAPLPAFAADDFQISEGTFLRVLGGSGEPGSPYLLADVFGLQGMNGFLASSFALANDIDASGTAAWDAEFDDDFPDLTGGFEPIGSALAPFTGEFDGAGYAISGLTIDTSASEGGVPTGLFGVTGTGAVLRTVELVDPSITGSGETGALAGINNGTIENVAVTAGGTSESAVIGGSDAGGLVGANTGTGTISKAFADIDVFGSGDVGGFVGSNAGAISLAYALGDVSGFDAVGGFAGTNTGSLNETYAVGFVDDGMAETSGGLVATGSTAGVSASFWDIDTTGQTDSAGGIGLDTDNFQDPEFFVPLAAPLGWNFQTDWAPPNSYPVLYALTPVIFADAAELTLVYGFSQAGLELGEVFGGPDLFVLGPAGDSLDTDGVFATPGLPEGNVGTYPINVTEGTVVSAEGVTYTVVPSPGTLSITPAPLTITALDAAKLLGTELVFQGTEFSVEGLVPGDSVGLVTLTSEGAPANAPLFGSPYPIFASNPQGVGLFVDGVANYDISFVPGDLTVTPVGTEGAAVTSEFFAPVFELPNPGDEIVYGGTGGGPIVALPEGRADSVATAEETLRFLEQLAGNLDGAVEACRRSQPEVEDYLDCLGTALDQYAAQIDTIALALPEPLRGVSATIQQASREIAAARETAVQQLATARTPAERTRIRRQAAQRAQAAVATATAEIRKQIALIRADEPQLARLQSEQGDAITAALDRVGADLERVVGL